MNNGKVISFSEKESMRFGYKIWRGDVEVIDVGYINGIITKEKPDIVILRVPVEEKISVYKLYNRNFEILHCDTMLYYECDLIKMKNAELQNNLVFNHVTEQTQKIVEDLIEETFANYKNHYFANPILNKQKITEGYKEWAYSFLKDKNKYSWYVTLNNQVVAFLICEVYDEIFCQPFLSGVNSQYRKSGIYSDTLRYAQNFFKKKGLKKMCAVTQVQNYYSNRTLVNIGFVLQKAYDTYHLNCFNSQSAGDNL